MGGSAMRIHQNFRHEKLKPWGIGNYHTAQHFILIGVLQATEAIAVYSPYVYTSLVALHQRPQVAQLPKHSD